MAGQGLYGQQQGNENRPQASVAMEHFADNHSVEGVAVAELRRLMNAQDWLGVTMHMETLRCEKGEFGQGFSDTRLQAIYGQASFGTSFC